MQHVVFIAPFPAETTLRFVRAVKALKNVRLTGVVHSSPTGADKSLFDDQVRITDPMNAGQLCGAIEKLASRHGHPHRILGILEPLQITFAELREHFSVPGCNVQTASLFRDKSLMKDALRKAGLPCARHKLVTTWQEAASFAEQVGFPIILKPPVGVGCKSTWRITSLDELRSAIGTIAPNAASPTLAEEMLRGQEHSFEALVVKGKVVLGAASIYHPTVLEVVENPWIQWIVESPREIAGPAFDDVRAMGVKAVQALGLQSGLTHMEWFRRPDGSLAIGEIAARPPGAQIVRLHGLARGISFYRAWARAVVHDVYDGAPRQSHAVACAYLRGMGRGRVLGVDGVKRTRDALGELIAEAELPVLGAPKSDSYEGDGYVILRHPDSGVVRRAAQFVIDNIRVHYG